VLFLRREQRFQLDSEPARPSEQLPCGVEVVGVDALFGLFEGGVHVG